MTMPAFALQHTHASWQECLTLALNKVDLDYLHTLKKSNDWLPGEDKIFSAFTLPLEQVNYVLFGESPYPRRESANGYAFWDDAVEDLWSPTGLSKKVNRATSMRNILKMLLIAEDLLKQNHTTQDDIASLDKSQLVQTNAEFFNNLLNQGFLLLNATPVLQSGPPQKDARAWLPFVNELLNCLIEKRPHLKLILFGRIAQVLEKFIQHHPQVEVLCAEHPYNISFITNPEVIAFFHPLHLLKKL